MTTITLSNPSQQPAAPSSYTFPCVRAEHVPHPLPRYADNPLIGALRFPQGLSELKRKLTYIPQFSEDIRAKDRSTRRLVLQELKRFRLAVPRLCELAETSNGTMIESYVGRVPHTPESNRRLAELYRHREKGTLPLLPQNGAEFAGAMIGKGGCGKTFAMNAVAGLYECTPVIHHEDLGVWQIPMVKLAMPFLGASRKTLAIAIIHEIDRLFPAGNYARLYLTPKANSNQLLLSAFALLQIHCVGYVFIDDSGIAATLSDDPITRKESTDEKRTPLTTLLIAMSNQAGVPILFSGTPELKQMLGRTNSLLRRSTGQPWGPLSCVTHTSGPSEFDQMLGILWSLQVLQAPAPLDDRMRELMWLCSYGIPDTLVKLFTKVQMRALYDGVETITEELVRRVALTELRDLVEVALAHHEMDRPGARERLIRMSDIRAEYAPYEAPQGEFGRPKAASWSLEQAWERHFPRGEAQPAVSEPEDHVHDGVPAMAEEDGTSSSLSTSDAAKGTSTTPVSTSAAQPKRKKSSRRASKPREPRADLPTTPEAHWTEVGT